MPAPRLLDKKLVNAALATQQKREIEKGIAISKKVDAVRDTLADEQARLDLFRTQSLKTIEQEIASEVDKREYLRREIKFLAEERIKLLAPIDLSQAWEEVNSGKAENSSWKERLSQESMELLAEKEDNRVLAAKLSKEEEDIGRKDVLSEQNLLEAERKRINADSALSNAEREAQAVLTSAQERDNHSRIREEDATLREVSVSMRETAAAAHEADLSSRERKLRSSREVFLKAQAYIKNKHK